MFMSSLGAINGLEFSANGERLDGAVALQGFPRLSALETVAGDGTLHYVIEGCRDEFGRPGLAICVEGKLQLVCQRCMEPLEHVIRVETWLGLASTQAEIDADPTEAPDRVLATSSMPVVELIEDEVLLALPYAPRHSNEDECRGRSAAKERRARSPFGELRRLIG